MRRISVLLAATTLAMVPMSTIGLTADFPYNGIFTAAEDLALEVAQQKCALSFFVQHADGGGANYVLDVEKFLEEKSISYVKTSEFSCKYDEASKIDTCNYKGIDAEGESTNEFFDYYDKITPTLVTGYFFTEQKQLDSFIENQMKPDASTMKTVFARCSNLTVEITSKYISGEKNAFPRDKTYELGSPDMSAQSGNRELADRVLQQIKSEQ